MFTGVEGIKESLTSAYGSDEVSVANAAMRWMVHHSQLDARYGGNITDVLFSLKEQWLHTCKCLYSNCYAHNTI